MNRLATNFFEICFSKNEISVPYFTFKNKDHLSDFKYDNPNLIISGQKDKIFFWGNNNSPLSTDVQSKLNSIAESYNFIKFFAESFINKLRQDKDFKIKKDFNVYKIIVSNQDLSEGKYNGINLFRTFHIHFTSILINERPVLGFSISMSIKPFIYWKIQDFINNNISIKDLIFNDKTGNILINTKSITLLTKHFKYSSQIKDDLDKLNAIQNEFEHIRLFVKKYIFTKMESFILPDMLEVIGLKNIILDLESQDDIVKNKILAKPECFCYAGKTHNSPYIRPKIKFNKPFTYDEFENRNITVNIILPKIYYSETLGFFNSIKTELSQTFGIKENNISATGKVIDDFSLKSYQKVLNQIKTVDLVLVVIDESHKQLSPNESPYHFCKLEFIKRGINTQEVQIQQIHKFLSDRKNGVTNYTDHNIALNIYAKLGGMAWTIKPNEPKNELIIGIGATTDKDNQPIMGLTSVFRGDGKYILGKAIVVTGMDGYQKQLEKTIAETITQSLENGSLDSSKECCLIFHIFKPAGKDNEIKALKNVLAKFSKYSFSYSFVHIGDGHNYRFFTYEVLNNEPKFDTKRGFGQNRRGTFLRINEKFGFIGLSVNSSTFLKIEIHKDSTFMDLEYIANQVYQFAEISHTSYNKPGRPITIKYPSLMASVTEKLKEINGFYSDEITMQDNSLWFI